MMISRRLLAVGTSSVLATLGGLIPSAIAQTPPARMETEFKKAGYQPLSVDKIRQLLVGNTAYYVALKEVYGVPAGAIWMTYYPDAKNKKTKGAGNFSFPGIWGIEGNTTCGEAKHAVTAATSKVCTAWYETPGFYYLCVQPTGECDSGVRRVVPGNPEKL